MRAHAVKASMPTRRSLLATAGIVPFCSPASAAPRFTFSCDTPFLLNLYWTVAALTDEASDQRKFWEARFGLTDDEREALDRLGQLLPRLRGRYQVWEADTALTPFTSGPMVGLFIAPMSSYEQRVQMAMATTSDLGTVRGRMPELSFAEINTLVGACSKFFGRFDHLWETVAKTPQAVAASVRPALARHGPRLEEFLTRTARVYGVTGEPAINFQVHFVWSPRATGGQCTLLENQIIVETSAREDPQRFLLGMLHEVCHHFSALAPTPTKYRRTDAFLTNGAYFPPTLLEEALATALAEGVGSRHFAPTLFTSEAPWVDHHGGRVDRAAKAIVTVLEELFDRRQTLDPARMREIADRCERALAPRPRDFTTMSLVTGRKELRDHLRAGISQGSGLRYGMEFRELALQERPHSDLPAWFNRIYLLSGESDLAADAPLAMRWPLPLARPEFEALRAQHARFVHTRIDGARREFVLYAPDDSQLRTVCDAFKQLLRVREGAQPV